MKKKKGQMSMSRMGISIRFEESKVRGDSQKFTTHTSSQVCAPTRDPKFINPLPYHAQIESPTKARRKETRRRIKPSVENGPRRRGEPREDEGKTGAYASSAGH